MDIFTKLRLSLYGCEVIAAIAGFLNWKKIGNSYWKWFPVYLSIIAAIEILTESTFASTNSYEFTIAIHDFLGTPLQFFFFFWIFHQYFRSEKPSYLPLIGAVIYLLVWIIDLFFLRGKLLPFVSFSYSVGNLILLVLIILFFVRLASGELILKYSSMMIFWVSLGLLVFYLGSFPLYGMYNTLAAKHPDIFNSYWKFATLLDCIMYLLFAFALIWKKTK